MLRSTSFTHLALVVATACICHVLASTSSQDFLDGRIVGGETAKADEFPYQVSLRRRLVIWNSTINDKVAIYKHSCGGSILNERWIVTSAHCTQLPITTRNLIAVGAAPHVDSHGIRYPLDKIISYPGYVEKLSRFRNDIGLLRTRYSIKFSPKLQPIAISREYITGGLSAIITGWGRNEDLDLAGHSAFAHVFTLSNEECIQRHDAKEAANIFDTTLCTYKKVGRGICSGDVGGPLVVNQTLVGLASWGVSCAKGRPDMFTRISLFANWIEEQTAL